MVSSRRAHGDLVFESKKMLRPVRCESNTERKFFASLDALREVLWFHEQASRIRYRMHSRWKWYYPDAVVALTNGHVFVAEVKMPHHFGLFATICKANALIERAHHDGHGVFLGNCSSAVGDFVNGSVRGALKAAVVTALRDSPRGISAAELRTICRRVGATRVDLQPLIFKERLVMTQSPFNLRRAMRYEEKEIETFVGHFESFADVLPLSGPPVIRRPPTDPADVSHIRPLYGS